MLTGGLKPERSAAQQLQNAPLGEREVAEHRLQHVVGQCINVQFRARHRHGWGKIGGEGRCRALSIAWALARDRLKHYLQRASDGRCCREAWEPGRQGTAADVMCSPPSTLADLRSACHPPAIASPGHP